MQTEVQKRLPPIPNEVLLNLFCRLPWKSVSRFKCLNHYWHSTMETPLFIELQAKNRKEITVRARNGVFQCFYAIDEHGNATEISPMIRVGSLTLPVVLSCQGLLCFIGVDTRSIHLFNPYTRETLAILPVPDKDYLNGRLGFGFDSTIKKYKVVMWPYGCENNTRIRIFTAGDGECKEKIANFGAGIPIQDSKFANFKGYPIQDSYDSKFANFKGYPIQDSIYVNGDSHWLTRQGNQMITFNYVNEVFEVIAVPDIHSGKQFCLREFGGRICLVEERYDGLWFWVLADYENHEWVRHHVKLPFSQHLFCWQNLLVIRDGEILVNDRKDRLQYLCRYDENGKVLRMLKVTGLPSDIHHFCFETQTLSRFRLRSN